jgi:HAD superfamily hydrolase (TIGR01544 family)
MTKLEEFKKNKQKIIVLTDFNKTLTLPTSSTSFSTIRKTGLLPDEYKVKAEELYDEYRPYELGEKGESDEECRAKIKEWWKKHFDLMIEYKLSFKMIQSIARDSQLIHMREGFKEFFDFLYKDLIPLKIISAGLGDLIIEILLKEDSFTTSLEVFSNFFEFDENGIAIARNSRTVIDTLNKEINLELIEKTYVIVMGDCIEDLRVLSKLKYEEVLKIGFLVDESKREVMEKKYDILLKGDASLHEIIKLLK